MLILSESHLRAVLTMPDVIEAVEQGFRALGSAGVNVPERLRLEVPAHKGVVLEMPAYAELDGAAALGTKIVSVFEENDRRGLGIVQSVYVLLDAATGVPLSLMDGRFITAIRTAATSAVATRHMSGPGPKQLAVFGAGVQAEFHIEAMIEVQTIVHVMIASRSIDKAGALAERIRATAGVTCEAVSAEQAAAANLICTCTSSGIPLFDGHLLKAGTHINAVGTFTPSTRELDTEAVQRARVIIDDKSAAGSEAGDILIPISEGVIDEAHVKGTLSEVVNGAVRGRVSASDITLFKSCGIAIEDLMTARLAYSRAVLSGVGTRVEM